MTSAALLYPADEGEKGWQGGGLDIIVGSG